MEREKAIAAELRTQSSGKERHFMLALEEAQTANRALGNNVDELIRRLEREECLRREREGDVARMHLQMDVLVARGSDSESKCIQLSKAHQQELALRSSKQADVEQNQRNRFRESQSIIQRLSTDLESMKVHQSSLKEP